MAMAKTRRRERENRSKSAQRRASQPNHSRKTSARDQKAALQRKWRSLGLGAKLIAFSGAIGALSAIATAAWSAASFIYPNLKDMFHGTVSKAIAVNVDRFGAVDGEGVEWVFPRRVHLTATQLRGMGYAMNGARQDGAYMLNQGFIQLRITSKRDQQIMITNVTAVDVARLPAASGTLIHLNGAGDVLSNLVINFDHAPPVVEAHRLRQISNVANRLSDPSADGGLYATHPDIALKSGDTAGLSIGVASVRYAVSFRIRITYAVGGQKQQSITVGVDSGTPFRISPSCTEGRPVHFSDAYAWGNPGHDKDLSPMLPSMFKSVIAYGCTPAPA